MALVQCYECGGSVSEHAIACPHCGYSPSEVARKSLPLRVFLLALLVAIVCCMLIGWAAMLAMAITFLMGGYQLLTSDWEAAKICGIFFIGFTVVFIVANAIHIVIEKLADKFSS